MTRTALVLRYTGFAVLATLVNLGAQRLVLGLRDDTAGFALAVFIGITLYALWRRGRIN